MCGLAGVWNGGGRREDTLREQVERMMNAIIHRGPDDAGQWMDAATGIALGFRRLAIVDLSPAGHQPMRSPSGRFTMVFNGEVFNSEALTPELRAAGFTFRGHSDTEVMLAAFEHWGVEAAVKRFVGMFAIALWDAHERRLHMIRDRLGIKPLFVCHVAGTLAFGSELKAVMAAVPGGLDVDPAAVRAYLRFFYVPGPLAIFRNVSKVPPGTILSIRDPAEALPPPVPYWSARDEFARALDDRTPMRAEEAVAETDRLVRESVRLRMAHADVPVGAFLSGGVDSSTVVAIMQQMASRRMQTYTIGFSEAEWDESRHAEAVARHLGTDHTTLRITPEDLLAVVPTLPQIYDEPFADVSAIPTCLVSRLARQQVTVALSGDGGDEVFGGYNRYAWGASVYDRVASIPAPVRRAMGAGLTSVRPATWGRMFEVARPMLPKRWQYRLIGEKLHKVGGLMRHDEPAAFYRRLVAAWDEPESLMPGARCPEGIFEEIMRAGTPEDLTERMMLADLVTYLPDNNLAKVDRASMAVSLEVRVPLLDHRLVEWSFRLPAQLKGSPEADGLKWTLRQVLYRYVPRALIDREKMGFDVPIGRWLRGPLREWAGDLLAFSQKGSHNGTSHDTILRAPALREAWDAHQAGRTDHGLALWTVLMLRAWADHWHVTLPIDAPVVPPRPPATRAMAH